MHADNPKVIEAMLHYIDNGWPGSEDPVALENVLFSLKLFHIAHKYDCSPVEPIGEIRYERSIRFYLFMTTKVKVLERKGFETSFKRLGGHQQTLEPSKP